MIVSVFFCMYFRDSRRGSDGKISTGDSLIATLMNTGVILFFNVVSQYAFFIGEAFFPFVYVFFEF